MVRTANQVKLDAAIAKFADKHGGFAPALLSFLQRDGTKICWVSLEGDTKGILRVNPAKPIKDQFGISLEIPVLVSTHQSLQPRILRQLENHEELRACPSADKDFAILVATDPRARNYARDRNRFSYPILAISTDDLASGKYDDMSLRSAMAGMMRSINYFDNNVVTGIRDPADFFGRVDELRAIVDLVSEGHSVGIFGLRKSGKTSLMLQVRNVIRSSGIESIFVELNEMQDADHFRETLVERTAAVVQKLGGRVPDNSDMLNRDFKLRKIGRSYHDEESRRDFIKHEEAYSRNLTRRRWLYEMDWLLTEIDREVVIMLDETDLANERALDHQVNDLTTREQMNFVLQQLRGLIQVRAEREQWNLCLILAGVSAAVVSKATCFGRENQLFSFASPRMLAPMSHDEMTQMVEVLGRRSGLRFDDPALFDSLYNEYGGHPHLTRQACGRVADGRDPESADVPHYVTLDELEAVYASTAEGSPAYAAQQTLESFELWYSSEAHHVRETIAGGVIAPLDKISHAVGYGICYPDGRIRQRTLLRSTQAHE